LRTEIVKVGYGNSAVVENYVFSDVFAGVPGDRLVPLAAFTQTPPSYRNAAFGVIAPDTRDAETIVAEYRALGAPLLFLLSSDTVTVWQVRSQQPPRVIAQAPLDNLAALFAEHRQDWNPSAIHRAKSIGAIDKNYQLDFVDAGLLPMVEGQVHAKLDRLIEQTLAETLRLYRRRGNAQLDHRALFRATFRLLAAKVLQDRGHLLSKQWDPNDIDSVLETISQYYGLPRLADERADLHKRVFGAAWGQLRNGINFRNISSDDLAFVYENTLITPETRKHFGTHSTPRQVAEYVVSRLEFWRSSPEAPDIYEPFAGAGVFLVAALRHLRELLPPEWSDRQRHDFVVKRITGDELDVFACEVATLSLILADYPNANGWKVSERDLFADNTLTRRARQARITLCNPPFEAFTAEERASYPEMAARSTNKGAAVLNAILDAEPGGLGFVLPRAFLDEKQFQRERERVEELFAEIELVALPEGTFKHSTIESALLIARSPRELTVARSTTLRSSVVARRDRDRFLQFGQISESRSLSRPYNGERGHLWIRQLEPLWKYLDKRPRLGEVAELHRGIEWKDRQSEATSTSARAGYRRGFHNADSVRTFVLRQAVWMDTRPERLLYSAINLPWDRPKVIANAVRLSRGPWRLAAAIDSKGLVASQQLFGCWLKAEASYSLETVAAILNGPVANAFVTVHSPAKGIRVSTMRSLPLPVDVPNELPRLVADYIRLVTTSEFELGKTADSEAAFLLTQIDALILKAYELPPKLERELLELFRDAPRPTLHPWRHWLPADLSAAVPLHEYLSAEYTKVTSNWVADVFKALPEDEAELLRDYME
jgi:hypothetical protein